MTNLRDVYDVRFTDIASIAFGTSMFVLFVTELIERFWTC